MTLDGLNPDRDPDCRCVSVVEAARAAFADTAMPPCPTHDPAEDFGASGQPIALNDDAALVALIGNALGTPLHSTDSF